MLSSKANWKYINNPPVEERDSIELAMSPVVKDLFLQRGITTTEEANQFMQPDLDDLFNPFLLQGMDKAVERIRKAAENQEKILVYGDYDADGVSSTVILLHALKKLEADCEYYIPNRFTEGYGPNESAFRQLHQAGFGLIITVDTGIAAVHEAEVAKELGIDLIITDHHEPQAELPDCYAIIHPKVSKDYSFKELAGVGVSLKLAEALIGELPKELLPFTAIGTIADLVPLVSENRILATFGLKELQRTSHIGLKALKQVCQLDEIITEEDIGFRIGPRLNAVGRLGSADLAVDLLLEEDYEVAVEMANELNLINDRRKKIVQDIVEEAMEMVQTDKRIIIVAKEGWNEGVLGIVASKLVQKFDRPAIVLAVKPEQGIVKGSARSIPAFDLFEGCMTVRDLFTHFGGHSQAAGMTLPIENLNSLETALNDILLQELSEEDFKQELNINATLDIEDIDVSLIEEIARLAPFGMGNPKPLFEIKEVPKEVRQIGSKKNHLKMQFTSVKGHVDTVGFGFGELKDAISPHTKVSVAGELSINEWNGRRNAQMMIKDLKITEWQLFDFRGKKAEQVLPDAIKEVFVSKESIQPVEPISTFTYEEAVSMDLTCYHTIGFTELPDNLDDVKQIIKQMNPKNIVVAIRHAANNYPFQFPSRKEFVDYYGLIKRHKQFRLAEMQKAIEQHRGWNEAKVSFMSDVFADLSFAEKKDGWIRYTEATNKKDLTESEIYQTCIKQKEAESILIYSNYQDLKKWFASHMDTSVNAREEVVYGL
ncbi:single-stranded-DNA-specific exonuclease RecJ [Oceanobacillus sp. J11TS1]|uniref:single-stranded-DNA-specific exonuclease RecJ n=1 Tax=Oceanobacillus sp. J11TS1 TaxID=2807191 RepID=UPI001B1A9F41|nr:single-stranded-DNA-specific exonuclease RecJ [Oceanobacillus sp. J11TS1]GIO21814.1 single-stranded-DNA-specific exonuclease [Oceanobacillus sp. J11TS1]